MPQVTPAQQASAAPVLDAVSGSTGTTTTYHTTSQSTPPGAPPDNSTVVAPAEPITKGDVLPSQALPPGEAQKPVTPGDAAAMQIAGTLATGHVQKGGPAARMQSAAAKNIDAGAVEPGEGLTTAAAIPPTA